MEVRSKIDDECGRTMCAVGNRFRLELEEESTGVVQRAGLEAPMLASLRSHIGRSIIGGTDFSPSIYAPSTSSIGNSKVNSIAGCWLIYS